VHVHALRHVDNQLDVGVVVVVGPARHLDVLVGHANVLGVGLQVLGRRHDGELDGALIAKRLVRPLAHGADLLDRRNTVVCNQHVCDDRVAVVGGHKVLDLARRRRGQTVAADEVRRQIELGRVAARSAIGIAAVDAVGGCARHDA
jgi:hypothetical protein